MLSHVHAETHLQLAVSQTLNDAILALMVPVVTASVGGVSLLIKDYRTKRSIDHRRQRTISQALLEVQFLTSWIESRKALGPLEEEATAREWLDRCYESAELAAAEEAPPQRKVNLRRILLFTHLSGWSANYFRLLYWLAILWFNVFTIESIGYVVTTKDDKLAAAMILLFIVLLSLAAVITLRVMTLASDKAARKPPPPPLKWNSDGKRRNRGR